MKEKKLKLSLEPYKGTRDFYPEDEFIQEYMFSVMRRIVGLYGYVAYNASILEEAALYRAKSGEEIANEQTYIFTDRGDREVTIRPEMTPTLARMIAKRRQELAFPLRWYSIPNVFRYERPQRGRLREHWQLNADIFGITGIAAEAELIEIAFDLMRAFGAKENDFEIRVTHRELTNVFFEEVLKLNAEDTRMLSRLIDKRGKESDDELKKKISALVPQKEELLETFLNAQSVAELPEVLKKTKAAKELAELFEVLSNAKVGNVVFSPSLIRGFDYYTGILFEVFDTDKANPRSLFGGGRYDELLNIFGVDPIPAAGFGMGDVTMRDYLETHNLLPSYTPGTDIYICIVGEVDTYAENIARFLRDQGIRVALDFTKRKIGVQVKTAVKQSIPFVLVLGEEEKDSGNVTLKELETGNEWKISKEEIVTKVRRDA